MILFLDCEWNGFKGALLSMALTSVEGHEWYEVLQTPTNVDPWVRDNVVPKLNKAPISYKAFQKSLGEFLRGFPHIHVVADWPEDLAHFCESLITGPGFATDHPPLTLQCARGLNSYSDNPHNALADARAIRNAFVGEHR